MNPVESMPMKLPVPMLRHGSSFGDAEAFCALVRDHAGMVFATARRITGDAALAEDVAQETFLALARQRPATVKSVGAWLHRVAWRKACDVVQGEIRRRRCEETAMAMHDAAHEAGWKEVGPLIDEVLEELPEPLRETLVEHFLEGQTQQDIAVRRQVSQATISRQLEAGLGEVRSRLRARGVLCGTGLATFWAAGAQAAEVAPPALMASLGKLAVSGLGSSMPQAAGTSILLLMKATQVALAVAAVSIAVVIGGPMLWHQPSPPQPPAKVAETKPKTGFVTSAAPVSVTKSTAAQPAQAPASPAPRKVYHPPSVPESVRLKVDAIIRRHQGMTMQQLEKDPELAELFERFGAAIEAPEAAERFEKVLKELQQTKGIETGQINFPLGEGMGSPLGRSWLEAAVSDDPKHAQDWLIHRLEGASFEFTVDPTLEKTSEGVQIFPRPKSMTGGEKEVGN